MNLNKSLIAFFVALIPLFIIYKIAFKEEYVYLPIGDALAKGYTPFEDYNSSYVDYYYDYLKSKNENYVINKNYISEDIRIKDLTSEFNNIGESNIKEAVHEADVITLSIGSEELFSKLRSSYNLKYLDNTKNIKFIDEMFISYEELVKNMRSMTKKPIYLIGYYSPITLNDENQNYIVSLFNYLDSKFEVLEEKYNVNYVKISDGFINNSSYLPNINNAFPSLDGYNYIAEQIKKS